MNKRIVVLLLVVCGVCAPLLAGPAAETPAAGKPAPKIPDAANVNPRGVFPVVKSPTTLTLAIAKNTRIENYSTNQYTVLIQQKTGVALNFAFLPGGAETMPKVMLMFASNDLPEVLVGIPFADATLLDYGTQGMIRPLNDLIEQYGVEMQKMWQSAVDDRNLRSTMTFADGNIYYVPKFSEQTQNTYNHRCYIYTPWLDALGLKVPATIEEYTQALRAFKSRDPNRNGKADEVPYMGHRAGLMPSFFINSFVYDDNGDRLIVKNGKVDVSFTKPEFREALQTLNGWVKEGLLDPLTFTQDEPALKTILNQATVLVGGFAQNVKTQVFDRNVPAANKRSREYAPIMPLKGPHGVQLTYPTPTVPLPAYVITSACKSPAAAYRVADLMLSPEMAIIGRLGFEGVDWDVPPRNVLGYNGKPAVYRSIRDVWGMKTHNVHWQYPQPGFFPRYIMDGTAWDGDPLEYLYVQWTSAMELSKYVPEERFPPKVSMTLQEINDYAALEPTIRTYLLENITRFIVGDRSFGEWDAFVAEFDKMKLKELLRIVQAAYDRTMKK